MATPGVMELHAPPAEMLQALEAVQAGDRQVQARGGFYGILATLGFLAFVAVVLFTSDPDPEWRLAGPILLAVVVLVGLAVRAQRQDLEDSQILAALRFLRILRADLPPGRPVHLRADFRDYARKQFQTASRSEGWGAGHQSYRQPWLEFRGRLADGARLELSVLRKVERAKFWKQCTPSKSKLVVKDRIQDGIVLDLQTPGSDLSNLVSGLTPGPPGGLVGRSLETRGDRVHVVVATPRIRRRASAKLDPAAGASADRLLGLLAWLYDGVHRARVQAPPTA